MNLKKMERNVHNVPVFVAAALRLSIDRRDSRVSIFDQST